MPKEHHLRVVQLEASPIPAFLLGLNLWLRLVCLQLVPLLQISSPSSMTPEVARRGKKCIVSRGPAPRLLEGPFSPVNDWRFFPCAESNAFQIVIHRLSGSWSCRAIGSAIGRSRRLPRFFHPGGYLGRNRLAGVPCDQNFPPSRCAQSETASSERSAPPRRVPVVIRG